MGVGSALSCFLSAALTNRLTGDVCRQHCDLQRERAEEREVEACSGEKMKESQWKRDKDEGVQMFRATEAEMV